MNNDPIQLASILKSLDPTSSGFIDWISLTDFFSMSNPNSRHLLYIPPPSTTAPSAKDPEDELITLQDFETVDGVLKALDSLLEYAVAKKVKVMMDAEQTYFQAAIDDVALSSCRKWNAKRPGVNGSRGGIPTVFNTYQMYLVDALGRMEMDLKRAERGGYTFGIKIVRGDLILFFSFSIFLILHDGKGAYMVSERERAKERNYPSPIQPSLSSTHKNYNDGITMLLSRMAATPRTDTSLQCVIASHNTESVDLTVKKMKEIGVAGMSGEVSFATLMGMQDGIAFALAANGYKAFKVSQLFVPYLFLIFFGCVIVYSLWPH
jgi:proline dehydrogenase